MHSIYVHMHSIYIHIPHTFSLSLSLYVNSVHINVDAYNMYTYIYTEEWTPLPPST